MKRTKKVGWRIGSALGGLVAIACGAKVDVLESDSDTLNDGASAKRWATCDPTALEVRAITGDECGFAPPEGCGDLCSSCYVEYECSGRSFACDASGVLRVTQTAALDCSAGPTPYPNPNADPNAFWSDCMQALENGSGGDSCQGSWICARPAQDECCIEVTQCSSYTRSSHGGQALGRYRVCSDGCRALVPSPELPGPSSCADGETGPLEAGIPCTGDYICADRHDVSDTPLVTSGDPPTTLRWCGNGVVQAVTDFGTHGL